jgi:peroxiredoxin Q/BCP
MLATGDIAPDFVLQTHEGVPFHLSAHRGQWVYLWWFVKASSPTRECLAIQASVSNFGANGVVCAGICYDSPAENRKFAAEEEIPFPILSDPDRTVSESYGATRHSSDPLADQPLRITYLIDPRGRVAVRHQIHDAELRAKLLLGEYALAGGESR